MNRKRTLATFILAVLLGGGATSVWAGAQHESSAVNQPKVVFSIGKEDKSDAEFDMSGFAGKEEYACTVGKDCTADKFPDRHERQGVRAYDDSGVQRIFIKFSLDRGYRDLALRLARAGAETTVVKIDDRTPQEVTNTMLGSDEGFSDGAYDLAIGALNKGDHLIELTVADDGKGNGSYVWDAIALFAK